MDFIGRNIQLIGILLLAGFAGATGTLYWDVPTRLQNSVANKRPKQMFACPMHPQVTRSQPGRCPECGMVLTAAALAKARNADCPEDHACCPQKPTPKTARPPGHPCLQGLQANEPAVPANAQR